MDSEINEGAKGSDPHRLSTPRRSRSRTRRGDDGRTSRARSRSRYLERELEHERRRLRLLEDELEREKTKRRKDTRHRSSERRSSRLRELPTNMHHGESKQHPEKPHRSRSRLAVEDRCEGQSKRSRSPSFTSRDVLKILSSIKNANPPESSNSNTPNVNRSLDYKNIVPEFNPASKNQRIDIWLKKVNECALVYQWDEKTTIHFAMQKLQGLAKSWYESLNSILFGWSEWQDMLLAAFPNQQNYGQTLEDMLKRRSKFNEPIELYYYEKLVLLNQCEITGKKAVECIIHGISDRVIKSGALAMRCNAPDQLLQYLMSNRNVTQYTNTQFTLRNKTLVNNSSDDRQYSRSSFNTYPSNTMSKAGQTNVYCFNCKEKGHPYIRCSKPLVKCNRCYKFGHKTEACFSNPVRATNNDEVKKTMCIVESEN